MIRIINLAPYQCGADVATREALVRLNATEHLFQLIVDNDGRLLGTLTDGDVRRALLKGASLDAPVGECVHRHPRVGHAGEDAANLQTLHYMGGYKAFLPIVDPEGRVVEILTTGSQDGTGAMTALVMAGGPGTRLGERTKATPKPLLAVGGRPILEHVLSALEEAGVMKIYISVHYLAEQIEEFVAARANRAVVQVMREDERRGTVGALGQLPKPQRDIILVINGDVVSTVDFNALAAFHSRNGYGATICVARHEIDIPFGVIRHTTDGMFERIDEKPRISHFVAGGIYLLGPQLASIVPPDRPMDMPELLNEARALGLSIGLFPIHEYWIDVGRPHDLETADRDLTAAGSRVIP